MKNVTTFLKTIFVLSIFFMFSACGDDSNDISSKAIKLEQYSGKWNGNKKIATKINSTLGYSSTTTNEALTDIEVSIIAENILLIDGDTAHVKGSKLLFREISEENSQIEYHFSETKTGKLIQKGIEINGVKTTEYSMMGIWVLMTETSTITLKR